MRIFSKLPSVIAFATLFAFSLVPVANSSAQENKPTEPESGKTESADNFSTADPPAVRRIVFFNSGIAQVVHQGTIVDNQSVEIDFDRDQIDDVLKSLVFDDESGAIESVQYQPAPGKETLAARQLGPPKTLAETLQSYRGETISLTSGDETITGSILGVETRSTDTSSEEIVTLVTQQGIQTYLLDDAKMLQFDSPKVQEKFRLAMIGLTKSRDVERKSLKIFFAGDNERKVQFGYVIDAPIWRMTYRLDINMETPTLQGWAHVDNVTGFDWKNVYVDLRSGRPQAFNVDLFSPLIARRDHRGRDVFGIPNNLNLVAKYFGLDSHGFFGDQREAEGFGRSKQGGSRGWGGGCGGGVFGGGGGGNGGGLGGGGGTFGRSTPQQDREARRTLKIRDDVIVAATQERAAQMLQFAIKKPVNLASGRSAMLPVLNQPVTIKLLTQFDLLRQNPVAKLIAKITNGEQHSIVAGPVTVYQDGGFVGDAELFRTDISDEFTLAYGADQPISLVVSADKSENVSKRIRLDDSNAKTMIIVDRIDRIKRNYEFNNKDSNPRNVQLRLFSGAAETTPKPVNKLYGTSEFEFEVEAKTKIVENIVFDTPSEYQLNLSSIEPKTVEQWMKTGATIEPAVKKILDEFFELKESIKKLEAEKSDLSQHIDVLVKEQQRLTKIIEAVKTESSAEPFVKDLTEREKTLVADRIKYGEVFRALNAARQQLDNLLERDAAEPKSPN